MYCRYSANSTLRPLYGLRCRPERNPSTMVLAFSSSVPRRAMTAGSRNLPSLACILHPALRHRHGVQQPIDDGVGGDALGVGVEGRPDPVTQDRPWERPGVP